MAVDERRIPRHRWPTITECDRELERLSPTIAGANVFDAQVAKMTADDVLDRRLELMADRDRAAAAGGQL